MIVPESIAGLTDAEWDFLITNGYIVRKSCPKRTSSSKQPIFIEFEEKTQMTYQLVVYRSCSIADSQTILVGSLK
jgi:hypothetical protein